MGQAFVAGNTEEPGVYPAGMTRSSPRRTLVVLALAAVVFGCLAGTALPARGVIVFAFDGHPTDTLRVLVLDPPTLAAAQAYLGGQGQARIPVGPIVRGPGADPRYPFHFVPDSVRLAEVTTELCDAAPMHTPQEVDSFISNVTGNPDAPQATWCPWTARPIAVDLNY